MLEDETPIELDKPTTIEAIKKVQEPKVVKEKLSKKRIVTLSVGNDSLELDINERLPDSFLESKLKESQKYVPISVYRDIMRQIGEFGIPQFSDFKIVATGKWKSGQDTTAYKCVVTVERNKPGEKKPVILIGSGYQAMSAGILLSDAIHGNSKTLEARALRDCLKYSYLIFEFPEADTAWLPVDETSSLSSLPKTAEQVIKETAEAMPGRDIEKEIAESYKKQLETLWVELITTGQNITKVQILGIASKLKAEFWEEFKPIIAKVITADLNSSA